MLINTAPDDCLMYIGFIYFIFSITSILNVFMLSIEKKIKTLIKKSTKKSISNNNKNKKK